LVAITTSGFAQTQGNSSEDALGNGVTHKLVYCNKNNLTY
jgi:hypothetical protein